MVYTKDDIKKQLKDMRLRPDDTVLVHSSMKSIGEVEGRADTVLDAFIEYFSDGLLIFPTHTWRQINEEHNVFDPMTEPACVGILPNLFMKRPGVVRSWHPTHSVAALGRGAQEYVKGEEQWDTPCPRGGCWGKLYDLAAKILLLVHAEDQYDYTRGRVEWSTQQTDRYSPATQDRTPMDRSLIDPCEDIIMSPATFRRTTTRSRMLCSRRA